MPLLAPVDRLTPVPAAPGPPRRPLNVVRVVPWEDTTSAVGALDPRSAYVERYWLPLLGAQATVLVRRLADRLEAEPGGFDLEVDEAVRTLGLWGPGGARSSFRRAVLRLVRHRFARHHGREAIAVVRRAPTLGERDVAKLAAALATEHRRWEAARAAPAFAEVRRHARRAALDLLDAEGDLPSLERRLLHWGVHPALAGESAAWAWGCRATAGPATGREP
jgi:hypothetical protein